MSHKKWYTFLKMYQNQLQSTFTLIFKTPNTPLNPTFSETNSTHSLLYPLTTFNSKSQQTPLNLAFPRNQLHPFSYLSSNHFQFQTTTPKPSLLSYFYHFALSTPTITIPKTRDKPLTLLQVFCHTTIIPQL